MEKSLVLSVSAGTGCYRHIQISEGATLQTLSSAILDSVDFYDCHLHSFYMNNRAWDRSCEYACRHPSVDLDDAQGYTDEISLSVFHLSKGKKFLYLFDYGDDWRFRIRVLRVIDEPTDLPLVLKSVGEINRYSRFEDNEDDEDDENY